jgi:hypothetical protein
MPYDFGIAELLLQRSDDDTPGLRFEDARGSWRGVASARAVDGARSSPPTSTMPTAS